jgi:hypothetical protein
MAFSSSQSRQDVVGSMQVKVFDCNFASVTTGAVKTGFSQIFFAGFNNGVTEAQGLVKVDRNAADDGAEIGTVNISGVTSDDTGKLIVFGI